MAFNVVTSIGEESKYILNNVGDRVHPRLKLEIFPIMIGFI